MASSGTEGQALLLEETVGGPVRSGTCAQMSSDPLVRERGQCDRFGALLARRSGPRGLFYADGVSLYWSKTGTEMVHS